MTAFKIGENLPAEAAALLRKAGHYAVTVLDQTMGGVPDATVSKVCVAEQRAILTLDLDFSDIRAYLPSDFFGIVVLRLAQQDKQNVLAVLERLLPSLASEPLVGKLWTVDESQIRIRE
ncbi:MAG: DUF5615 family PIN-like protein [Planctomycetota bacterium]